MKPETKKVTNYGGIAVAWLVMTVYVGPVIAILIVDWIDGWTRTKQHPLESMVFVMGAGIITLFGQWLISNASKVYNVCGICKRPMRETFNCGGDCVFCMAEAGDPDCVKYVIKLARKQNQGVNPSFD